MPRFSVNDLLFATALVAIGILMVTTLFEYPPQRKQGVYPIIVLWFGGGAMIGAGLFVPFGKARWGVCVGIAVQLVVGLALIGVIMS